METPLHAVTVWPFRMTKERGQESTEGKAAPHPPVPKRALVSPDRDICSRPHPPYSSSSSAGGTVLPTSVVARKSSTAWVHLVCKELEILNRSLPRLVALSTGSSADSSMPGLLERRSRVCLVLRRPPALGGWSTLWYLVQVFSGEGVACLQLVEASGQALSVSYSSGSSTACLGLRSRCLRCTADSTLTPGSSLRRAPLDACMHVGE